MTKQTPPTSFSREDRGCVSGKSRWAFPVEISEDVDNPGSSSRNSDEDDKGVCMFSCYEVSVLIIK